MISSPVPSANFVGRVAEQAFLRERFDLAYSEHPQFVVLEGDAGIGKSRLIEEFRRSLGSGVGFGVGYCLEYIRAPYLAINSIFEQLGSQVPIASSGPERTITAEDKLAHFSSITIALAKYAARRPLVMVIEDIQWADDATMELVQHLAHSLKQVRILLLLTCRADSLRQMPHLGSLIGRLSRAGASRIHLSPLEREEIRLLVAHVLKGHVGYSADLLAQIEAVSDGNPLFIEELLRAAREITTGTRAASGEIPLTIKAMLWERVLPLSNKERDILTHAAVIGRSFDADFLAGITGRSKKLVLEVLQRARDLQLIVDQSGNPPVYSFRHTLLRETLYRELLPDVVGPLHARIAAKLEELPDTEARLTERAYHWTVAGIEDKAIECNEQAGDAAAAVYAYSDAIRFYRQALGFRYPAGLRRARLYERFGRLLYLDGRENEPTTWLEKALEEYRRLGDREGIARVFLDTANQCWLDGQTERSIEAATPAVTMLVQDQAESSLLSLARVTLARYQVTLGNAQQALDQLDSVDPEALTGEDGLRAAFNEIRGEAFAALGKPLEAVQSFERALSFVEADSDAASATRIRNAFAMTATDVGRIDLARTHFESVLAITRRHGLAWRQAYSAANYAFLLMLAGELAQAHRQVSDALSVPPNGPLRMRVAIVGIPLGLMLSDDALVNQVADEGVVDDAFRSGEAQRIGAVCGAFARLYNATGQKDRAVALLERALERITVLHRSWMFAVEVATSCSIRCVDRVLQLLGRFEEAHPVARAHVELIRSMRERRFPGTDSSKPIPCAVRAAELFLMLEWPWHEALCLDLAGEPQRAVEIFNRIGDVRDAAMLRMRYGSKPPAERQSSDVLDAALTKRQGQVAELIAGGASNREIASALAISENTVEHHVSEIYRRLGIVTRSQLISRMAMNNRLGV